MTTSHPERIAHPKREQHETCTPPALQVANPWATPLGHAACGATPQWRRVAARPGQTSRSTTPSRCTAWPAGHGPGGSGWRQGQDEPRDQPLRVAGARVAISRAGHCPATQAKARHNQPVQRPNLTILARQHNPATQPSNTTQQHERAAARRAAAHSSHRFGAFMAPGYSPHATRGHTSPRHKRARQAAEDRVISACAKPPPRRPGQR